MSILLADFIHTSDGAEPGTGADSPRCGGVRVPSVPEFLFREARQAIVCGCEVCEVRFIETKAPFQKHKALRPARLPCPLLMGSVVSESVWGSHYS